MTWHLWMTKESFLRCGSCGAHVRQGQYFARLDSGLVRCEDCYGDLQTVCAWPRVRPVVAVAAPEVRVDYSEPSQPWATVQKQVRDYKRRAARDAQ